MVPYYREVVKFLDRDGGMELILAIDTETGTKHTEFEQIMAVSRGTVSNLIKEANQLDLLETTRHTDDHGNAKRYTLSQIGRVFRVALESMGVDESYQTYLESRQELEEGSDELREWIIENSEFWTGKTFENEFSLQEPLKNKNTYPGDDVPSNFVDFLVGEKPLYQKIIEAKERRTSGGERTNSEERDSSS